MIKTIKTLFAAQSGDQSPMYLDVVSRTVTYPNTNKFMQISYKYFLMINNMETSQTWGDVELPYYMIQSLVDWVLQSWTIKDEDKTNDELLDEVLPYLLLEYMKSNIDENWKTPFAIPTDDWEVYAKPVVEEIVKDTLSITE